MSYKLNPDHAYIVVLALFFVGAGLKYSGEYLYERVFAQAEPAALQVHASAETE